MSTKGVSIAILIIIVVIMIIYTIVLFECFKKHTWLFKPYVPPEPPSYSFKPLGQVTNLTPSEIADRNNFICSNYFANTGKVLHGCPNPT